MSRRVWLPVVAILSLGGVSAGWLLNAQSNAAGLEARLWQRRNLGKALYENPATQQQAVEQFRQALQLSPKSARERLNYGLALIRAGNSKQGITELEAAQKQSPELPHTWFNLGIAYKHDNEFDKALVQFRQMAKLTPDEPVVHYQIASLLKIAGDNAGATAEFEKTRALNPRLAAPHFQLYGLYRQQNRAAEAAAELAIFQEIKKQQEGAAIPEDMEWCYYAEIYDPIDIAPATPPAALTWREEKVSDGFGSQPTGLVAIELDGGTRPSLIAWSADKVTLFRGGRTPVADSGLEALRGVIDIAVGDYDNDGLPDLCIVTSKGAELWHNVKGKFTKQTDLASGNFRKALWIDYDHDYDIDVLLVGGDSKMIRNNGDAGFSDESAHFPFVSGAATAAVLYDLEPDTPGFDIVVAYENRVAVLYHDKLGGSYEARDLAAVPEGTRALVADDFNHEVRNAVNHVVVNDMPIIGPDEQDVLHTPGCSWKS